MIRKACLAPTTLLVIVAAASTGARAANPAWSCQGVAAVASAGDPAVHPLAGVARQVFDRMAGSFYALTGRKVELVLLPPAGLPRSAVTCPRQGSLPPRIYATWELLDLMATERYPLDFLAFVLAHELGHRAVDMDQAGNVRRERMDWVDREARADARGAFFAVAAGNAVHKIACDDMLETYLTEYKSKPDAAGVPDEARQKRQHNLESVLDTFGAYEALYDAALGLGLSADPKDQAKAQAMLAWADGELEKKGVVVPEMKLMHALVLIGTAGPTAHPLKRSDLDADLSHLRCEPIFPGHTRLSERRRGARGAAKEAFTALRKARALVNQAQGEGASPLLVESALGCASYYLGEMDGADAHLGAAEVAAKAAKSGSAVLETLAANRALVGFSRFVLDSEIPEIDDMAGARGWAKKLVAQGRRWKAHEGVAAALDALASYPEVDPAKLYPKASPASATRCKAPPADGMPAMLPAVPLSTSTGADGRCPCGWTALHDIPVLPADGSGEAGSLKVCVPSGWARGARLVRFQGAETAGEPATVASALLVDVLDGRLGALGTWLEGCSSPLESRGASDDGARALAATCPELGLPRGLLFASERCTVDRAIMLP